MAKSNTPLISFIVPVYNVEEYLPACLDSLVQVDIHPIEIILINDGSTDHSGKIIDLYATLYPYIIKIHQPNKGLSATRNRGMRLASGDYIAFVDSDDWLIGNQIVQLYQTAVQNNVEMVLGNTLFFYPSGYAMNPYSKIPDHIVMKILSGKKCFAELMHENILPPMACNYLYKRELLLSTHVFFEPVLHEDELWTPIVLCLANRAIVTNINFYGYRQRDQSIMHTLEVEKRICDLIYIANKLIQFARNRLFKYKYTDEGGMMLSKAYNLYFIAFELLKTIHVYKFKLPHHLLYAIFKLYDKLPYLAKVRCRFYYRESRNILKAYLLMHMCAPNQEKTKEQ